MRFNCDVGRLDFVLYYQSLEHYYLNIKYFYKTQHVFSAYIFNSCLGIRILLTTAATAIFKGRRMAGNFSI